MGHHANAQETLQRALDDQRTLTDEPERINRVARWMTLGGIGIAGLSFFFHLERFWAAYLIAFTFVLSITLGALFFVIIQHVVKAHWSVVVRRVAEAVAGNMPLVAVLFAPLVIGMAMGYLHPKASLAKDDHHVAATHGDDHGDAKSEEKHGGGGAAAKGHDSDKLAGDWKTGPYIEGEAHTPMGKAKKTWLSFGFVVVRFVIYFLIWIGLARFFWGTSLRQDETKDKGLTDKMQRISPIALLVYALTASLAGFDLLMALQPYWYSTMFGVYFWAGGFVSFCATLIIILALLQRSGKITKIVSPEHYHDVGKFMFAWIVFWSYVSYSQYMLIWYGNIPEETVFFHIRQTGGWMWISLIGLLVGHFMLPFLLLISRFPKRRPNLLVLGAAYVLFIHFVDLFWIVAPAKSPLGHVPVPILDVALVVAILGIYMASTVRNLNKGSLVPIGDPRLAVSMAHVNY